MDIQEQEELLGRLRSEHGKIAAFEVDGLGLVAFKGTTNKEAFKKYFNALTNSGSDKYNECVSFALHCVVHPSPAELRKWLSENLGDAPDFAAAAADLCQSKVRKIEGN